MKEKIVDFFSFVSEFSYIIRQSLNLFSCRSRFQITFLNNVVCIWKHRFVLIFGKTVCNVKIHLLCNCERNVCYDAICERPKMKKEKTMDTILLKKWIHWRCQHKTNGIISKVNDFVSRYFTSDQSIDKPILD